MKTLSQNQSIEQTIKRFEEIMSVKNRTILGRPLSVTVEEKELDIAQFFVEDQRPCISKPAQQHDTCL